MRSIARRTFLRAMGQCALGAAASGALPPPRAARPPNIAFILADDLGWAEPGCYGNRFNETPHIDALARDGVRFTDAYTAAPVCSPTRASLLTGQYPARVGITDYLRADDRLYLSPSHVTIAERLRAGGYRTALLGKWHLMGDYRKRRGDPSLHGFDEIIGSETRYIGGGDYFAPYAFMPEVKAHVEGEYLTDRLNEEAVAFIRRHRERPFFLYLSHYAVHTRLDAPPAVVERFRRKPGAGKRRNHPVLAAMIARIDDGVGRILAELEAAGIDGNTVLIFTSDNGGEDRVTSNAPLRGGKSQLYEGGIRVPLIVRWPGHAPRGTIRREPVTTVDFYPTMLQVAGLAPDPAQHLDGVSLVPLLEGKGPLPRRALFWHYPLRRPHFLGGRSSGAIREGPFKLIEFFDTGAVELYDLEADPGERRDLAGAMPEKVAALRGRLAAWRREVRAEMPRVVPGSP